MDNGSNFLKAFAVYGVTEDEIVTAEPLRIETDKGGEFCVLVCEDDTVALIHCNL